MPSWEVVYAYVMRKQLASVTPEEAQVLVATGKWVLLDVRPPASYEKAHPVNAASAPLYQSMDMGNLDLGKMLKVALYAFNGINPVEQNPDMSQQVKDIVAGGKGVITMCEAGGTLTPTPNFPVGKSSRSFQAAFKVMFEGLVPAAQVKHMEGGVYGWYKSGLPFDGEYDTADVGRSPNAASAPPLEALRNIRK